MRDFIANVLLMVATIGLVVGLIKPKYALPFIIEPTRPKAVGAALVAFVLAILVAPIDYSAQRAEPKAAMTTPAPQAAELAKALVAKRAGEEKPVDPRSVFEDTMTSVRLHADWSNIEARRLEGKNYDLALIYSQQPSSMMQVKVDTAEIMRIVLKSIMAHGGSPSDDWYFVTVAAERPGLTGETGKPLVEYFGLSVYNFSDDSINFKPSR